MPPSTRFMLLFLLWMPPLFSSALYAEDTIEIGSGNFNKLLQQTIKDRTLKLSPDETTLQYQLFKELQKQAEEGYSVDVLEVERSGIFQELIKFPEKNRGKLFQAEGEIRHVIKLPVDKNALEITSLYQIHFYPFDSEGLPLLLVCTSLPKGITEGNNLLQEGTVVGLFFKIQSLPEESKQAAAPLLLVESLSPKKDENLAMGLSSEYFSVINHKSKGFGDAEVELYYRILRLAQIVPQKDQVAAARQFEKTCRAKRPRYQKKPKLPFATYYDLFKHYEEYEGKPVTLKGVVREHKQYPADENDYGITTLHELWIFTEDAQTNPAVLVCTSVPEGFPVGKEIMEVVEMTGFFFKMYGYKAQDNSRRVPMLLGEKLKWYPDESPPPAKTDWRWVASIAVLFCLVIFALWRMRRRDKGYQAKRERAELPDEPDFSNIGEQS